MEIWKDVPLYEGFYQVSNKGNVRNLAVYSYKYKRVIKRKAPRMLMQDTTHDGYKRVRLSLYGEKKHFTVHRLVAEAFIPNPDKLPCVNHKDETTDNNTVENLEWCTWAYNGSYGKRGERISKRQINSPILSKAVFQYAKDGTFISAYPSQKEASRQTGVTADMIGRACRGKAKTAGGFIFKFA